MLSFEFRGILLLIGVLEEGIDAAPVFMITLELEETEVCKILSSL